MALNSLTWCREPHPGALFKPSSVPLLSVWVLLEECCSSALSVSAKFFNQDFNLSADLLAGPCLSLQSTLAIAGPDADLWAGLLFDMKPAFLLGDCLMIWTPDWTRLLLDLLFLGTWKLGLGW